MPKFLAVDFYCGAGGTTRGLLDAGGYVICGIDNDPVCKTTYESNNRNAHLDGFGPTFVERDMFAPDAHPAGQQHLILERLSELIPRYRSQAPGVPLLFTICAPCQSFTKFKQTTMTRERRMARDRDESLLSQAIPFIKEFEPELILSENVIQIRRGHAAHIWKGFKDEIAELGYQVGDGDVCASKFGVPQFRRRSVLLGARTEKEEASPYLMELRIPSGDPKAPRRSVRDAIGHLPRIEAGGTDTSVPNHSCRKLSPKNKLRLRASKPGEPNFGLDRTPWGDLSLACHTRLGKTGKRGFGDVYTRMHPDRPSPTITTRFISASNGRFGHYDPDQARALSIREGAALQSFPDDYQFKGASTEQNAKMIGNAVPPRLAACLATWLIGGWKS